MRTKIKRFALRALERMSGTPLTGDSLMDSISTALPESTATEQTASIRELECAGLIASDKQELLGLTYTLTPKGRHVLWQLSSILPNSF